MVSDSSLTSLLNQKADSLHDLRDYKLATSNNDDLVFAPEVQCDFEITESYFLLVNHSGSLTIVRTMASPVRGRGDKSLVGGATWVIGGLIPSRIMDASIGNRLQAIRVVLKGSEGLQKVVSVPVPIAEDLHPVEQTSSEIRDLISARVKELERAEGRSVQAQAELERMRAQVDELSDADQLGELNGSAALEERMVAQYRKTVQSLEERYAKLKLQISYPFGEIVQGIHESAIKKFEEEIASIQRKNRANSSVATLSPEIKSRLIQLGRSFDPKPLKDRLEVLRKKTRDFEDRLYILGIDLDEGAKDQQVEEEWQETRPRSKQNQRPAQILMDEVRDE
jgi:hypothetical protein